MLDFATLFDRPAQQWPDSASLDAAIRQLLPQTETYTLIPLSGGFRNFNYRLETLSGSFVLRLSTETASLQLEAALLERLGPDLPVPAVVSRSPAALLLSFCPGLPANGLARPSPEQCLALGAAIGEQLARVHRICLPGSGFLHPDLTIGLPLEPFAQAWLDYTRGVFTGARARRRAGPALCDAVLALIARHGDCLTALPATNRLVHSDFNLKNLLVEPTPATQDAPAGWRVSALLDWEFAHAGAPLTDLANFLRFEELLPPALCQGFLRAYQRIEPLPADWRRMALMLDLAALAGFLESEAERPLSFNTAIGRLKRTLKLLA